MDNSSKAFIIAGAVLIAVMVASLTMAIVGMFEERSEGDRRTYYSRSVQVFNSQYEAYLGDGRSREVAAAVCHLAENNNKNADAPYISCPSASNFENKSPQSTFTITGDYDPDTGYICSITIK